MKFVKDGSRVRRRHPSFVYFTAQRLQYIAVQQMCTPLEQLFLHYNLGTA